MEAINSAQVFEEYYDASEEELIPLVEKETMERYLDHYDEPSYLFRGVIIGLSFCLPFWAIIFWIIIWLLIIIHFLKLDEAKRSNCVLLSPKVMIPCLHLQLPKSEGSSNRNQLLCYLANILVLQNVVISDWYIDCLLKIIKIFWEFGLQRLRQHLW